MVIVGIPGALTLAGAITLFQRNTEDSHRGRAFGALGAVEGVAVLAGTAGAGFLGQSLGIIPVLAFQGASYVVAGPPPAGAGPSEAGPAGRGGRGAARPAGGSAARGGARHASAAKASASRVARRRAAAE